MKSRHPNRIFNIIISMMRMKWAYVRCLSMTIIVRICGTQCEKINCQAPKNAKLDRTPSPTDWKWILRGLTTAWWKSALRCEVGELRLQEGQPPATLPTGIITKAALQLDGKMINSSKTNCLTYASACLWSKQGARAPSHFQVSGHPARPVDSNKIETSGYLFRSRLSTIEGLY